MASRSPAPPDLAIDLGSARVRLAARGRGLVADVPSVVLREHGKLLAVGEQAWKRTGPSGQHLLSRPIREGVVEDFNAVEALMRSLLDGVGRQGLFRPRVLLTMEPGATEVGTRAVQECLRGAGAREVCVADAAVCRTAGVGLRPEDPIGSLVCDIGAGGSRASICSLGAVVEYDSCTSGGNALATGIQTWLRMERGLTVGWGTAENLVHHLVDASGASIRQARIRGTGASGHAEEQVVGSQELEPLIEAAAQAICRTLSGVLADASPELSEDILERGLVLTGEAAQIRGMAERLSGHTHLPVVQAESLPHAQVLGALALMSDPTRYAALGID